MAGFANDASGQDIVYANNFDFSGNTNVAAQFTTNGQLLIGASSAPFIRVGFLTSSGGTIAWTFGAGTISGDVVGSKVGQTITTQDAAVLSPAAGNWNWNGAGSLTTTGSGSTATMNLTGLTNHNVLIGAGTSTITKVAPSATSGVPLISQGASADPAFGTAVVAGGGTGAVSLTGVLTGNGTSAFTASAVTQHDVLVGGASNAITSVAPSATTGVPLVSQGASADPAFGTAVVAGGGTGDTSFTAYSVITGGTTSTGALQNVVGVGTSGQILTSNGASALPSWQPAPTTVLPFTDEGTSFNAASNNGYFATAAVTATLPASPAQGDLVEIICDTASQVTIQANTGQFIRLGATISSSAGTAKSNSIGDVAQLRYRSADTTWIGQSSNSTWTLA